MRFSFQMAIIWSRKRSPNEHQGDDHERVAEARDHRVRSWYGSDFLPSGRARPRLIRVNSAISEMAVPARAGPPFSFVRSPLRPPIERRWRLTKRSLRASSWGPTRGRERHPCRSRNRAAELQSLSQPGLTQRTSGPAQKGKGRVDQSPTRPARYRSSA